LANNSQYTVPSVIKLSSGLNFSLKDFKVKPDVSESSKTRLYVIWYFDHRVWAVKVTPSRSRQNKSIIETIANSQVLIHKPGDKNFYANHHQIKLM